MLVLLNSSLFSFRAGKIGELSLVVYKNLCDELNEKVSGIDYIALTARMKYTIDELKKFERCNPSNPTDKILLNWRTKNGHGVSKLIKLLRKIER